MYSVPLSKVIIVETLPAPSIFANTFASLFSKNSEYSEIEVIDCVEVCLVMPFDESEEI